MPQLKNASKKKSKSEVSHRGCQNFKNSSVGHIISHHDPNNKCTAPHQHRNQGLRARARPNLGALSKALVSNSPEMVTTDFGFSSCCKRAPSLPVLLSLALTVVRGSSSYCPPTVTVFSLVVNLLRISTTAELFCVSSKWCTYEARRVPPLSVLISRMSHINCTIKIRMRLCNNQNGTYRMTEAL